MENIENYLNTMIFIVIAKGLTIVLLLLLLLKMGQQFSFTIITFQLGLLGVAIWAIYVIVDYNRKMLNLKAVMGEAPAQLDTCPSYFTKIISEDDKVSCAPYSDMANGDIFNLTGTDIETVDVSNLLKSTATMDSLCTQSAVYRQYPWAEFKAKCNM